MSEGLRTTPVGVGDRVKVCDPNAPWYGYSGVITGRGRGVPSGPYSVWMVELDGLGGAVAHYEKELRHATS